MLLRLCISTGAHSNEITLAGTSEGKQYQFKLSRNPVARRGGSAALWYQLQPNSVHSYISATLGNFLRTSRKRKEYLWLLIALSHVYLKTSPDSTRCSAGRCDRLQGPVVRLLTSLYVKQEGKVRFPQPAWVVLHPLRLPQKIRQMVTFIAQIL